jgi:hypothetical protein
MSFFGFFWGSAVNIARRALSQRSELASLASQKLFLTNWTSLLFIPFDPHFDRRGPPGYSPGALPLRHVAVLFKLLLGARGAVNFCHPSNAADTSDPRLMAPF